MKSQEEEWLLKEKYGGEKSIAFFADCKRLALGEPLAYLIGFSPFLDCKIWLDNNPLIPRPETEYWAEEAISAIKGGETLSLGLESKSPRILDLCAGSGCIGVAVAKAIPEARVDFGEIDARLLPTITKNIVENILNPERSQVFHTSLFSNIQNNYDFILSNPPYIDETLNRTEKSVKNFEPYIALFGGEKGMEIISDIILKAPAHLAAGGQLWLEHEPEQSQTIKELGEENNFSVTTKRDQFKVERYSILVLQ
ncbi:peptide chain release factor N(5)-glutamine methyltransferase [Candidatus Nomurabacteria bacterium]|nr:peptide chain release factor N(5)-glutamine methyltransferase [Candidatus Nomurabacteria bacterium]